MHSPPSLTAIAFPGGGKSGFPGSPGLPYLFGGLLGVLILVPLLVKLRRKMRAKVYSLSPSSGAPLHFDATRPAGHGDGVTSGTPALANFSPGSLRRLLATAVMHGITSHAQVMGARARNGGQRDVVPVPVTVVAVDQSGMEEAARRYPTAQPMLLRREGGGGGGGGGGGRRGSPGRVLSTVRHSSTWCVGC